MSLRWSSILVLLCFLAPSEALAQNPRLTLKLAGVTCAEALEALSRTTGIPVSIGATSSTRLVRQPGEVLQQRASFNWEGTTFANALRAVCERYNLRPSRQGDGYSLIAANAPPAAKVENRVGLCEVDGHRFFARSVSWYQSSSRSVQFPNGAPQTSGSGSISLTVDGRLGELDAATIAGLENVTATDDLGNRMQVTASGRTFLLFGLVLNSGSYPDEWTQTFSFRSPHPKARKIAVLEADVMTFRKADRQTLEVPYPFPGGVVRKQFGGRTMVVSEETTAHDPEELKHFGIPELIQGGQLRSFGLKVRTAISTDDREGLPREVPVLYDETGKAYMPTSRGTRSTSFARWRVYDSSYEFHGLAAPPKRLVWTSTEKSDPVKLLRLRMTDIPLPPAPAGLEPGNLELGPKGEAPAPLPDHPFAAAGGGTLIFKTERGGKSVQRGTLSVGLAPVIDGRPGTLRWVELPVDAAGIARLLKVKPGTYQLHRKYRAENAPGAAVAAGWLNAKVTVVVKPGVEIAPPPLRAAPGAR